MVNKITREDVGDELFDEIIDEAYDISERQHRREATFFQKEVFEINKDFFPEIDPAFHGFWESNKFIYDEHDYDKSRITELKRVVQKKKVVETTYWEEAETP
jgi:hypothetical protein